MASDRQLPPAHASERETPRLAGHAGPFRGETAASARVLLQRGVTQSHRGEFGALRTLSMARDAFRVADDANGETLSAAALLVASQAMNSYKGFTDNADRLARFREGALALYLPLANSENPYREAAQRGILRLSQAP